MMLAIDLRHRNPSSERVRAHLLPMGEGVLKKISRNDSFSHREKVPDRGDEGFHAEVSSGVFH